MRALNKIRRSSNFEFLQIAYRITECNKFNENISRRDKITENIIK